jgi:hypothetical protein
MRELGNESRDKEMFKRGWDSAIEFGVVRCMHGIASTPQKDTRTVAEIRQAVEAALSWQVSKAMLTPAGKDWAKIYGCRIVRAACAVILARLRLEETPHQNVHEQVDCILRKHFVGSVITETVTHEIIDTILPHRG